MAPWSGEQFPMSQVQPVEVSDTCRRTEKVLVDLLKTEELPHASSSRNRACRNAYTSSQAARRKRLAPARTMAASAPSGGLTSKLTTGLLRVFR